MRPAAYKPIVDRFAAAIRAGDITPGSRLPTHRELAQDHGIALVTATRVYGELAAMGLVAGEPGRGTFVREQQSYDDIEPNRRLAIPRIADLSFNQPLAPEQTAQLRHALRELSTSGALEGMLYQQPPGGRSHERAIVATYLLDRDIDVPPANVFLTNGAQHALDSVLTTITRPGDIIAADALTYPGLKLLAAAHSLEVAPIPSTAEGPDLETLDRLCSSRPVRAIYSIPTIHNPLGWTLGQAARERLAEVARARDALIIEDGTYAFLDEDAPPPLQTIAPERTFYISSLSKVVATGLRFGFIVAPDAHTRTLTRGLRASTWGISSIVTALASGWIADGTAARLEGLRRDDAKSRQQIARAVFGDLDYVAHPASFFGWLRLPPERRADQAAARLAEVGILISTADAFATTPHPPHGLRLALANPARAELKSVLELVRSTVDSLPW